MEFDIKIRKTDNINFANADVTRLVNNELAYTIHDARISLSAGVEIEQNKYVGPNSTIMRLVTQKDDDLSLYFDVIDETETGIKISSSKQILNINHTYDNKGIIRGHLPLESIFGFRKSFYFITKSLGFELDLRTSNRKQDILYTTIGGNDVNVTINSISLYIPSTFLNNETEVFLTKLSQNL